MLDKKDYAILSALDADVRASYQEIGRKTRLSKEVVAYRLKQLEASGVLTGFWALIQMGPKQTFHKLLIKTTSLGSRRAELSEFLLKQRIVPWFAETEGNYDYVLSITTEDNTAFVLFLEDLFAKFGQHFQERHLLRSVRATATNEKYLSEGKYLHSAVINFFEPVPDIDDTGSLILTSLSANSRERFTEIAQKVGLTAEGVANRIKMLHQNKFITAYKIRIDLEKLGLEYYHVFITIRDRTVKNDIEQYYLAHPGCIVIMNHLGFYDVHLEFVVKPGEIQGVITNLQDRFGAALTSYELLRIRKEYRMNLLQ